MQRCLDLRVAPGRAAALGVDTQASNEKSGFFRLESRVDLVEEMLELLGVLGIAVEALQFSLLYVSMPCL